MTSIKAIVVKELNSYKREHQNVKVPYYSNKIDNLLIAEHNLLPKISEIKLGEPKRLTKITKFDELYSGESKMQRQSTHSRLFKKW